MTRKFSLIIILLYILSSCKNETGKKHQSHDNFVEIVYHFDKTSDSKFCNLDSLHQTDCELGNLYLTKKGNAIYHNYCLGTDSTTYCIGKYIITDTTIECNFIQDYSFAECTECDTNKMSKVKNNVGILKNEKHSKLILNKLNCNCKLKYYVSPTNEQKQNTKEKIEEFKAIGVNLQPFRGYVYSIADANDSLKFITRIKSVKELKDL